MRLIAAEAGVTAMALYNYAPSKADLFEWVLNESVANLYAGFAKAIVGRDTLVDEINAVFDHAYRAALDDPTGLRFTARFLVERDHPDLDHLDLHTAPYADFFTAITSRAIARGELARREGGTFVALVSTLLWGFSPIAVLDRDALAVSVAAAKSAVARFLHDR